MWFKDLLSGSWLETKAHSGEAMAPNYYSAYGGYGGMARPMQLVDWNYWILSVTQLEIDFLSSFFLYNESMATYITDSLHHCILRGCIRWNMHTRRFQGFHPFHRRIDVS